MNAVKTMGRGCRAAVAVVATAVLLAATPALAEDKQGHGLVEGLDLANNTIQLLSEQYFLTHETKYENEYGVSASLKDFEAAESIGPLYDGSTGSKVFFVVDEDSRKVKLLRLVKEIPG